MELNFINNLFDLTVFEVVKGFLVVGLVMYTAFAVVIIRQVKVMSESIEDEFNSLIILFAWVHLAVAVLLTLLAVVVL